MTAEELTKSMHEWRLGSEARERQMRIISFVIAISSLGYCVAFIVSLLLK